MKELEQLILSKSHPVQKEVKQLQKSELDRLIIEAFLGEQQQTLPGFAATKQETEREEVAKRQKKEQSVLANYDTSRKEKKIEPGTIYITGDPNQAPGLPTGFVKGGSKNEKAEYFLVEGILSSALGLPKPTDLKLVAGGEMPSGIDKKYAVAVTQAGYELGEKIGGKLNINRNNTKVAGASTVEMKPDFKDAGASGKSITDILIGGAKVSVKNAKNYQLTALEPNPLRLTILKILERLQGDSRQLTLFPEMFGKTIPKEIAKEMANTLNKYKEFNAIALGEQFNNKNWDVVEEDGKFVGFRDKKNPKRVKRILLPNGGKFLGFDSQTGNGRYNFTGAKREADLLNYVTNFGGADSQERGKTALANFLNDLSGTGLDKAIEKQTEELQEFFASDRFRTALAKEQMVGEIKFGANSPAVPDYMLYFNPDNASFKFVKLDYNYFKNYAKNEFNPRFAAGKGDKAATIEGVKYIVGKRLGALRADAGLGKKDDQDLGNTITEQKEGNISMEDVLTPVVKLAQVAVKKSMPDIQKEINKNIIKDLNIVLPTATMETDNTVDI
ncbi:MAG: hypothetical protein ACYS0I_15110 [Planctomycetota bacterium]|jgi:hypothetical protein